MTYTALMSLAILRDDFTKLDRAGILHFVRSCQREDGRHAVHYVSRHTTLNPAFQLLSVAERWGG